MLSSFNEVHMDSKTLEIGDKAAKVADFLIEMMKVNPPMPNVDSLMALAMMTAPADIVEFVLEVDDAEKAGQLCGPILDTYFEQRVRDELGDRYELMPNGNPTARDDLPEEQLAEGRRLAMNLASFEDEIEKAGELALPLLPGEPEKAVEVMVAHLQKTFPGCSDGLARFAVKDAMRRATTQLPVMPD